MKTIDLTLEQAKTLYQQGGAAKEFALQVFTEEELTKQERPRSWEEFCENYPIQDSECYFNHVSEVNICEVVRERNLNKDKNLCVSKDEAEAFLALMQLRQLRKAWIGEWVPDWEDVKQVKWCMYPYNDVIRIEEGRYLHNILSFPTKEMAQDFLECFRELIEKTKPLYK